MRQANVVERKRFARWCGLVLAAILCACGDTDATGPALDAEWRRYVLVEVDGAPPPALVSGPGADTVQVLADTIVFSDSGWATFRTRVRRVTGAGPVDTLSVVLQWPYTISGDSITIGVVIYCVTTPCPGPVRGVISEAEMLLARFETVPMHAYRYVRTAPAAAAL